jgi:hypothetical protein
VYVIRNTPEVASTNATSSQMVGAAVPEGSLLRGKDELPEGPVLPGTNAPPAFGGQVIFLQLNAHTKVLPYDASVIEASSALVG